MTSRSVAVQSEWFPTRTMGNDVASNVRKIDLCSAGIVLNVRLFVTA